MKLLQYIKGLRRGKDAHRIELEAMKDPFLSEALEGYDAVDDNHPERIERMREQINNKQHPKQVSWRKTWGIAAAILLCLSLGSYFFIAYYDHSSSGQRPVFSENINDTIKTYKETSDTMHVYMPVIRPSKNELIASTRSITQKQKEIRQDMEIAESVSQESVQAVSAFGQEESVMDQMKPTFASKVVKAKTRESSLPRPVYGKVTDSSGEPLIGATIQQKGDKTGTVTGIDGSFELEISGSDPLVLNYIGFESVEITPDTNKSMLIAMHESQQVLDEVVVAGYAQAKRKDFTGSISKTDSNVENELVGRTAGASVKKQKEIKPEPEIGMKAYKKYLKENIILPTDSVCKDVRGKVKLRFFVDFEGYPYNIQVIKSLCETADTEAIRLIKEGCRWKYSDRPVEIEVSFN